jgi:hypothetical protein
VAHSTVSAIPSAIQRRGSGWRIHRYEERADVIFGLEQPAEDIPSYNAMSLFVTTGPQAVTEEGLALARKEGENLAREAADYFGGRVTSEPAVRRVAGLPGVEMEVSASEGGHPVRLRMTFAWDGRTQYFFRCAYTQSHVQEMNSGCDQVLDSFQLD